MELERELVESRGERDGLQRGTHLSPSSALEAAGEFDTPFLTWLYLEKGKQVIMSGEGLRSHKHLSISLQHLLHFLSTSSLHIFHSQLFLPAFHLPLCNSHLHSILLLSHSRSMISPPSLISVHLHPSTCIIYIPNFLVPHS